MSRLGLRDPRSLEGVTGDPCGALKSKSLWDGGIDAWWISDTRQHREGCWRTSGDGRFGWFGPKTTVQASFPVWATNPGACLVHLDSGEGGHVMPSLASRRSQVMSRRVRPMLLQKVGLFCPCVGLDRSY